MARKSRKVQIVSGQGEQLAEQVVKVFKTAVYARLSVEDNRIKDGSSIEDQIEIVKRYIDDKPYLQFAGTYCDNGSSGTNFNRDGFRQLMDDIKCGKIDCLAVKDLSRFARNHLEAGNYLEKIFPFLGVRFISVNDDLDTFGPKYDGQSMTVALKTLIHDFYSRDLSNKVKAALKIKALKGDFIGDYAPYCYVKSPENKNKLIVDDEAAGIVRDIFKWRLDGLSCSRIAGRLNDQDILTPNNYKYARGLVTAKRYSKRVLWYDDAVRYILNNIAYTGSIINGKVKTIQNQGYRMEQQPESDWVVVQGAHDSIISKDDFEAVRRMSVEDKEKRCNKASNRKQSDWPKQENIFSGVLFCAECGRRLHRCAHINSSERIVKNFFCCRYCKSTLPKDVRPEYMPQFRLEEAVMSAINKYIEVFTDSQGITSRAEVLSEPAARREALALELTACKRKLSQLSSRLTTLYVNYQDDLLSEEDYLYLKARYDGDKVICSNRISELGMILSQIENDISSDNRWFDAIERISGQPLNSDIIAALIERIEVTHSHKLIITYKFKNPLYDNGNAIEGRTK
jgi:DNA invertase Pin-like site-specific DNA recombinase